MGPVLITRAAAAAQVLAEEVRRAGFSPILFPTIALGPAPDPEALRTVMGRLAEFKLVIFVSPTAIEAAFSMLSRTWPRELPIAVMGPGSVAALARCGVVHPEFRIISPADQGEDEQHSPPGERFAPDESRFDSESLYRQLDTSQLKPGPILVVKGNGGRTWLYDTLAAEGIAIETVQSYLRSLPVPSEAELAPLRGLIGANQPAQLIVTSSESLGNLISLMASAGGRTAVDWVLAQRMIVPHARIAENATALGFATVVLSGPGDMNIVRALK